MALFLQGLNPVLHEHLTLFHASTLNELVSTSIEKEDACRARVEEEKKKRPLSGPIGGLRQASHVVPLRLNSGATVHLSRWQHTLRSSHSSLLHLELHSLLG
jgi:hypothetical protein